MTTTLIDRPKNILKKDWDGHWYSIPEKMLDHFIQLVETVENSEIFSNEWYDAIDDLENEFGEYRKE
jgi:hypothetical protein